MRLAAALKSPNWITNRVAGDVMFKLAYGYGYIQPNEVIEVKLTFYASKFLPCPVDDCYSVGVELRAS
jgi:hypothetical protein